MLKIDNVTKIFKGSKNEVVALDRVSFEVSKGEVYGLLGTNGAGKTTMLRIIATTLGTTFGNVFIDGFDVKIRPEEARQKIGLLFGGDTGLYDRFSARENIAYFGRLFGMSESEIENRIEYLSQAFNIKDFLDRRTVKFSRGMKQKTAFARSIVHNPDIMLFDEPSSGLDVIAAQEVIEFIKQMKKQNKTILLSSHDMLEVEELCDRIGIIYKGKMLCEGTILQLKEQFKKSTLKDVFLECVKQYDKNIATKDYDVFTNF